MPGFDPATAASLLATLLARCDYKQFAFAASPTQARERPDHPLQRHFRPVSSSRVLVSWAAVYHGVTYSRAFVADLARQQEALNAALTDATAALNQVDLRRTAFMYNDPFPAK